MTVFEHDGWSIRDDGPGFWAADPDDRISVYLDGDCLHYEASGLASNVRWATPKEQARNRGTNVHITVGGVTLTIVEWEERSGLPATTLRCRLRKGWSPERAVSTPRRNYRAHRATNVLASEALELEKGAR